VNKTILVTGGAGFLGSHLCTKLVDSNKVICLDNFYTGSKSNIKHLIDHPNFKLLNHDVTDPINLNVDEIYNLACPASPVHYQKSPIQTTKTNVLGAINTLELAYQSNAKILQASTSEIYGDPLEHPQKENYWGNVNPIGPRGCYNEGKRCAETLFFNYHNEYNLPIKIVRIFNTYGPRMSINDGRVVSNFITRALKNEDIVIYGNGEQTRSFCYVDDLINIMIMIMNSADSFTGPVNIGNDEEISVLELAKFIVELSNSSSKIIFNPAEEDDPKCRRPDTKFVQSTFDWSTKVNLKQGLLYTMDYFRGLTC
jgi:UDP-glucuronate decarboxylase